MKNIFNKTQKDYIEKKIHNLSGTYRTLIKFKKFFEDTKIENRILRNEIIAINKRMQKFEKRLNERFKKRK